MEEAKKVKTKVRNARLEDLAEVAEMAVEFAMLQVAHGDKLFSDNPEVLKGGFMIELGLSFNSPRTKILVAEKGGKLLGFMLATLEDCGPTEKHLRCVRVRGDYIRKVVDSLRRPLILLTMWEQVRKWGLSLGAGYFFSLIHPGNSASIRVAKRVGFKHNMTQFALFVEDPKDGRPEQQRTDQHDQPVV